MTRRTDQIFQLSLTEIAFTLCFILLLLLGYLLFSAQKELEDAKARAGEVTAVDDHKKALVSAQHDLQVALQGAGSSNPDQAISKLVESELIRQENQRLKQAVAELDAKLTALAEIKAQMQAAANNASPDATEDDVVSALALQKTVRLALEQQAQRPAPVASPAAEAASSASNVPGSTARDAQAAAPTIAAIGKSHESGGARRDELLAVMQALKTNDALKQQLREKMHRELESDKEAQTVHDLVEAAKGYQDIQGAGVNVVKVSKENSDLRGQVAFLKGRLDARGGRDYPPCWADESGKVEFLFAIEVKPEGVTVTPAWPARREAAARALPGIDDVLASPYSYQEFARRVQSVFEWSKHQDPECRHYVELKSSIADAVQSDRARLMVENYFYKTEVRR